MHNKSVMRPKESDLKKENITVVSDIVGSWGPWQIKIFIAYTLVYITNPFLNNGMIFLAPRIDFWCTDGHNTRNDSTYKKCVQYENSSLPCTQWTYDNTVFTLTVVEEFNLVCHRSWMISVSTSVFQLGYATSSLLTGYISDSYGRLFTLKLCVLCEILAGIAQALAPSVWPFLVSRLFLGFFAYGKFLSGFVLLLEVVSPNNRAQISCVVEVGWFIGALLLPFSAHILPHFRYLQLCVSAFSIVVVCSLWLCTESPRWLIVKGRLDDAQKVVQKAARQNVHLTEAEVREKFIALTNAIRTEGGEEEGPKVQKQSLLNLWKVPVLLKYSLVFYFLWYVDGLINYSLIINIGELGGNIFFNHLMFTVTSILATVIEYFLLPRVNRRKVYFISMMLGAMGMFAIVPYVGTEDGTTKRVTFAIMGRFFLGFGFHLNHLQASEIFPTSIRQLAVGSCSLVKRMGSIIAPFSKEFADATHPAASMVIFGFLAVMCGFLDLVLPESRKTEIPDTIKDAVVIHSKKSTSKVEYTLAELDEL